jgi:hypothetical protein
MVLSCFLKSLPEQEIIRKKERLYRKPFLLFSSLIATCFIFISVKGQETLLDRRISIQRQHTNMYDALNQVSSKAECYFIYDSKVVDNNEHVKLEAHDQPVREVLNSLLDVHVLNYRVVGKHILIYRVQPGTEKSISTPVLVESNDSARFFLLRGHVYDNESKSPVAYATVGIIAGNLGTVTNADGYFILKVPARFSGTFLNVSHLGYVSRQVPVQLLDEQSVDFFLERRIISIQEVIIRYVDPLTVVKKTLQRRVQNYNVEPVYLTTFYREGVQKNSKIMNFSEAVFRVFKSSYDLGEAADQVKLLKSRKIQNSNDRDTVLLKLKAGIQAGLQLDIIKNIPSFLDEEQSGLYNYTYSDLLSYDDRDAYAITFEQKPGVEEALYKGTLYIEKESYALLGADFEVNPAFLDKAATGLVQKKSRKLVVKFEKISYSVSYTRFNDRYYLSHARSDLKIRTRLKNHLSSDLFNTFMEIATCHIDTLHIERFPRQQILKPDIVFSDGNYDYDENFWGSYNTIAPEIKLNDALSRIIGKLEKVQ